MAKKLKGHQIIGELRLLTDNRCPRDTKLKGHQIIGELRLSPLDLISTMNY